MRRVLAPLLLLLLSSCANPAKQEAASLVAAVDRFRRAENAEKPAMLEPLKQVACSDPQVCAAKQACVAHAEPTAEGLRLKNDVKIGLAEIEAKRLDPDAAAARALPTKLDEASSLLEKGHAALGGCDERVMALRLKFGL